MIAARNGRVSGDGNELDPTLYPLGVNAPDYIRLLSKQKFDWREAHKQKYNGFKLTIDEFQQLDTVVEAMACDEGNIEKKRRP
jgi:hypothetical protein